MQLRDVVPDDVDTYVRMRCDPAMTAGVGGPLPREGMGREGAGGPLRASVLRLFSTLRPAGRRQVSARSPVRPPVTGPAAR